MYHLFGAVPSGTSPDGPIATCVVDGLFRGSNAHKGSIYLNWLLFVEEDFMHLKDDNINLMGLP